MAVELKTCKISGCKRAYLKKGLCGAHYKRLRRHGDPTSGRKTFNGEPYQWLLDRVYYADLGCLIWPFNKCGHGYGIVHVNGKGCKPSRVMCALANGKPPTPRHQAAHSCGNGHLGCVHPKHLRWDTAQGNLADKNIHDTHHRGERQWMSKLTEDDVRQIRKALSNTSQSKIAKQYGVTQGAISRINTGEVWGWLK